MKRNPVRRTTVFLWTTALALYLCAIVSLMRAPVLVGHDTYYHISRLLNIAAEMRNGNPFPRIYSFSLNGLGYGAPLFYADLFLYPFAALNALGLPVVAAFKLMTAVLLAAVFFIMYFCGKSIYQSDRPALLAALAYAFSFYAMTDFFQRAAIGECLGFALLPVVYLGYFDITHGREGRWRILALGMTGLLLSHTLSALIAALMLVVLILFDAKLWLRRPKLLIAPVKAAFLCCGLACGFWLPMLEQMRGLTLKLGDDLNGVKSFLRALYTPIRLLAPPSLMALIRPGSELALPRLSGLFGYAAALIAVVAAKRAGKARLWKLLGASLAFVWLCGRYSPTQWLAKYLAVLQFPWRLMLPAALMLALFLGAGYGCVRSRRIRGAMFALVALSGATAIFVAYPAGQYAQLAEAAAERGMTQAELMNAYTSVDFLSGAQYLPAELPYDFAAPSVEAKASDENVCFELARDDRNHLRVTFSGNSGGATLDLPLILYLGYEAQTDSGELLSISRGELGMVRVDLGDLESGAFTVRFVGTPLQHIADAVSVLTILAFVGWPILRRARRRA